MIITIAIGMIDPMSNLCHALAIFPLSIAFPHYPLINVAMGDQAGNEM